MTERARLAERAYDRVSELRQAERVLAENQEEAA